MSDIIVIGGGAAGMMAAIFAGVQGASVELLERNEKFGKKIYITGKGRCNVTNDCTLDEFLQEVPRNPRFLYSALTFFSPQDMRRLLDTAGCPTVEERGRRVFPESQHASDVTKALCRQMDRAGVMVRLNCRVKRIVEESGQVSGVETESGEIIPCKKVVLACGGKSYPATGSTGDGYAMAENLGHTIMPTHGVLTAMNAKEEWCGALQGLSLKNVGLSMEIKGKTKFAEVGEMLFTHSGISGPMVLTASCHFPDNAADASLFIDMKPGLTIEQLDNRLMREFAASPMKAVHNVLPSLLPCRMADIFGEISGVDTSKQCAQFSKGDREKLTHTMKHMPVTVTGLAGNDEAIVTRGGVSVKEISPKTMESKLISGLYFAGEMIDVDAHTGGYNLQIAFSTGALAGKSAADNTL